MFGSSIKKLRFKYVDSVSQIVLVKSVSCSAIITAAVPVSNEAFDDAPAILECEPVITEGI
jgi:hypothetical protein